MAKPKVFIDSSVLISALLSSRGASFYILNNGVGKFHFQINEYVMQETQDVFKEKFRHLNSMRSKFFLLLGMGNIEILPHPSIDSVRTSSQFISQEDAPILSSSVEMSDYLVTLDNEFLKSGVKEYAMKHSLTILKPQDFISLVRR